jgi:hypothetical protein
VIWPVELDGCRDADWADKKQIVRIKTQKDFLVLSAQSGSYPRNPHPESHPTVSSTKKL